MSERDDLIEQAHYVATPEPDEQIKVSYLTLRGTTSTAYVSSASGRGEDKYTDEPVRVQWDEPSLTWREVEL